MSVRLLSWQADALIVLGEKLVQRLLYRERHRLPTSAGPTIRMTLVALIERPIQAFGVRWKAEDWRSSATSVSAWSIALGPQDAEAALALPDKPSIAVLPFQNMSGDPEQEYFADGIAEDIITELSRFKSLFVIARNSSFIYKGKLRRSACLCWVDPSLRRRPRCRHRAP